MNIQLKYEKNREKVFEIKDTNDIKSQTKEIEKDARRFSYTATGSGFAFFQVAYRYNSILDDPVRRFELTVKPQPSNNANLLSLEICAKYIPEGENIRSQMTLIEVYLPSGYVYDPATSESVKAAGVRVR